MVVSSRENLKTMGALHTALIQETHVVGAVTHSDVHPLEPQHWNKSPESAQST